MKKQIIHKGIHFALSFYFLFSSTQLLAQCNPAFLLNQTFGSGPNPGDSMPRGRTNCLYTTSPCPTEGHYTIVNSVSGCGNDWYPISEDNTPGDINGYLMLINAPAIPGDVYLDTANNICGNASLMLQVAIYNVSLPSSCSGHPVRPRLTISVESMAGSILATFYTGDIPESPLTLYIEEIPFRTPPGIGSVIVRITDTAPGGCGNDFTLDDIEIAACGPNVQAGFANTPGAYQDLCVGNSSSTELIATVGSGYNSTSYQWQMYNDSNWVDIPGATSPTYQFTQNADTPIGVYKYRLTTAEEGNIASPSCRVASNEVIINIHNPLVTGTATSNSPVCENSLLNLYATGGVSYQWAGPAGFTSMDADPGFTATHTSAGKYVVTITDASGCKSNDTTTVRTIAAPIAVVSDTQNICLGESATLHASGGSAYTWSPLDNLSGGTSANPNAKPTGTTKYSVTVTDNNNCTDTASVLVVVNTKPKVSAGKDKVIIKGQSVTLDGAIEKSANIKFSWLPSPSLSDISLLDPVANPTVTTDYVITATSGIGCGISSDTVTVKVYNDLYIPNAFSPNSDGLNDTWHIPALKAFPAAVLIVYNRFGTKIFESRGGNNDWDGTYENITQPVGVYPYVIDLKNDRPVIKGTITIIR